MHKYKSIDIIQRFNNTEDFSINANNIFKILKENNIDYTTIKEAKEYKMNKGRIENFTNENFQDLIYNTRIFRFIENPEKTLNYKASYALLKKIKLIHMHLILGKSGDQYYLNSIYINRIKDRNLSTKSIKIHKLIVIETSNNKRVEIYNIDYNKISILTEDIINSLKTYYKMNNEFYIKYKANNKELLYTINNHTKDINIKINNLDELVENRLYYKPLKKIETYKKMIDRRERK